MFWLLLLVGILLALIGVWGGPSPSRRPAEGEKARGAGAKGNAWEILAEPLTHEEEELIKIPEHRPWYLPGGDRRFRRGLLVGLGAGLMIASVTTFFNPRQPAAEPQTAADRPNGTAATGTGAGTSTPAGQGSTTPAAPQGEGQAANQGGQAPKAANVTFTVEVGDLPSTIAANLEKAGLIEDGQAFLSRVAELGLDTSLKAGTFVIPAEASLDQVIEALTL